MKKKKPKKLKIRLYILLLPLLLCFVYLTIKLIYVPDRNTLDYRNNGYDRCRLNIECAVTIKNECGNEIYMPYNIKYLLLSLFSSRLKQELEGDSLPSDLNIARSLNKQCQNYYDVSGYKTYYTNHSYCVDNKCVLQRDYNQDSWFDERSIFQKLFDIFF